jgi:hypothetical protein
MQSVLPTEVWNTLQYRKFRQRILRQGHGEGLIKTWQKGFGTEFSEYRAYEPGDNPKNLDWNHFAKTDKLYTKVFYEEKNISILLLVDGSNSMRFSDKWSYLKNLTLALSVIGIKSADNLSVCLTPEAPLINLNHIGSLPRVHDLFNNSDTKDITDDESRNQALYTSALKIIECAKSPSLAVVISDFLTEKEAFANMLDLFRFKNIELTGIQLLDKVDIEPLGSEEVLRVIDSETGTQTTISLTKNELQEYKSMLNKHNKSVSDLFFNRGANFISIVTSENLTRVINSNLVERGLLA